MGPRRQAGPASTSSDHCRSLLPIPETRPRAGSGLRISPSLRGNLLALWALADPRSARRSKRAQTVADDAALDYLQLRPPRRSEEVVAFVSKLLHVDQHVVVPLVGEKVRPLKM